jgi:hypothetical protein
MALGYILLNATVPGAGTRFYHGLTNRGVAAAPTEWMWVPSAAHPAANTQFARADAAQAATTTLGPNILGSGGGNFTVDFFCAIPHSVIG